MSAAAADRDNGVPSFRFIGQLHALRADAHAAGGTISGRVILPILAFDWRGDWCRRQQAAIRFFTIRRG